MAVAANKASVAMGLTGAGVLAQLFVLRAVSSATDSSVTLAGHVLAWGCSFQQAFGVPCPNCGMTRSVVFALHGEWGRAFLMNPAGPLVVVGALLLAAALFYLALRQRSTTGAGLTDGLLQRRLMLGTAAYCGLVVAVLLANWVRVIV
jgi:hypothetical protein